MLDIKRIIKIVIIILLLIIVLYCLYYFFVKDRETPFIQEYTPQEEISEEQLRMANIRVYFKLEDKLDYEVRNMDAKKLIDNPYQILLQMLIDGPKDNKLNRIIKEGTKINKIERIDDLLLIDLTEEFTNSETEELAIESIVKTLTELNEINKVKILINGDDRYIKVFTRE